MQGSPFDHTSDDVIREGDYVRTHSPSEQQVYDAKQATIKKRASSYLRDQTTTASTRPSRRHSKELVPIQQQSRHRLNTSAPSKLGSASSNSFTEQASVGERMGIDMSSVDTCWHTLTAGTWLGYTDKPVSFGTILSVNVPNGLALVSVWREGDTTFTHIKKPLKMFPIESLLKLSNQEFSKECKLKVVNRLQQELRMRQDGMDVGAPFALTTFNNRVVNELLDSALGAGEESETERVSGILRSLGRVTDDDDQSNNDTRTSASTHVAHSPYNVRDVADGLSRVALQSRGHGANASTMGSVPKRRFGGGDSSKTSSIRSRSRQSASSSSMTGGGGGNADASLPRRPLRMKDLRRIPPRGPAAYLNDPLPILRPIVDPFHTIRRSATEFANAGMSIKAQLDLPYQSSEDDEDVSTINNTKTISLHSTSAIVPSPTSNYDKGGGSGGGEDMTGGSRGPSSALHSTTVLPAHMSSYSHRSGGGGGGEGGPSNAASSVWEGSHDESGGGGSTPRTGGLTKLLPTVTAVVGMAARTSPGDTSLSYMPPSRLGGSSTPRSGTPPIHSTIGTPRAAVPTNNNNNTIDTGISVNGGVPSHTSLLLHPTAGISPQNGGGVDGGTSTTNNDQRSSASGLHSSLQAARADIDISLRARVQNQRSPARLRLAGLEDSHRADGSSSSPPGATATATSPTFLNPLRGIEAKERFPPSKIGRLLVEGFDDKHMGGIMTSSSSSRRRHGSPTATPVVAAGHRTDSAKYLEVTSHMLSGTAGPSVVAHRHHSSSSSPASPHNHTVASPIVLALPTAPELNVTTTYDEFGDNLSEGGNSSISTILSDLVGGSGGGGGGGDSMSPSVSANAIHVPKRSDDGGGPLDEGREDATSEEVSGVLEAEVRLRGTTTNTLLISPSLNAVGSHNDIFSEPFPPFEATLAFIQTWAPPKPGLSSVLSGRRVSGGGLFGAETSIRRRNVSMFDGGNSYNYHNGNNPEMVASASTLSVKRVLSMDASHRGGASPTAASSSSSLQTVAARINALLQGVVSSGGAGGGASSNTTKANHTPLKVLNTGLLHPTSMSLEVVLLRPPMPPSHDEEEDESSIRRPTSAFAKSNSLSFISSGEGNLLMMGSSGMATSSSRRLPPQDGSRRQTVGPTRSDGISSLVDIAEVVEERGSNSLECSTGPIPGGVIRALSTQSMPATAPTASHPTVIQEQLISEGLAWLRVSPAILSRILLAVPEDTSFADDAAAHDRSTTMLRRSNTILATLSRRMSSMAGSMSVLPPRHVPQQTPMTLMGRGARAAAALRDSRGSPGGVPPLSPQEAHVWANYGPLLIRLLKRQREAQRERRGLWQQVHTSLSSALGGVPGAMMGGGSTPSLGQLLLSMGATRWGGEPMQASVSTTTVADPNHHQQQRPLSAQNGGGVDFVQHSVRNSLSKTATPQLQSIQPTSQNGVGSASSSMSNAPAMTQQQLLSSPANTPVTSPSNQQLNDDQQQPPPPPALQQLLRTSAAGALDVLFGAQGDLPEGVAMDQLYNLWEAAIYA